MPSYSANDRALVLQYSKPPHNLAKAFASSQGFFSAQPPQTNVRQTFSQNGADISRKFPKLNVRWVQRVLKAKDKPAAVSKGGRPPKTTKQEDRQLCRCVIIHCPRQTNTPVASNKQITNPWLSLSLQVQESQSVNTDG